jgi:hypothetical protein
MEFLDQFKLSFELAVTGPLLLGNTILSGCALLFKDV